MASRKKKEQAPSDLGQRLVARDYTERVASLGEQIYINRRMLLQAIGSFDPENISYQRMSQMRRDPMIQLGLHYCKFPLLRAQWHCDCEDPQIGGAVEEIIRSTYGPYMRTMLNFLDYGFQAGVKQFELGSIDGTYEDPDSGEVKPLWDDDSIQPVVLAPPLPLPPEFTSVKLEKGKFMGIETVLGGGSDTQERFIPPEWSLWMVNEFEESFRNWYGYPRTGYAYRYWWSYWFRHHMEDRHFEMDADPPLRVHYPPGSFRDPDTGQTLTNKEVALQIGQDARQGATIAIPSDVHIDETGKMTTTPLWDLDFLTGGENLQAFRESAEYLDVLKLRSILVPEQAIVEGKGGTSSRNAAASYAEIFNESLGQQAEDIDDYWNRYIIPQLVEANWGPDAPKVTKVTSGFESEDLELTNELIKLAFSLDPNALPIKFEELLKKANLPVYTAAEQEEREEAIQEMQEEARKRQEEQMAQQGAQGQGPGGPPQGGAPGPQGGPPGGGGGVGGGVALAQPNTERLYLHQNAEKVAAKMPGWAKAEFDRRMASTEALQERIQGITQDRYEAFFSAAAEAVAGEDGLELSVASTVGNLLRKAVDYAKQRVQHFREPLQAELASMYHAAGAAELMRLGMDLSSWDVGREEVQGWAEEHAGELISTMDQTLVEQHLRPWLTKELGQVPATGYPGQDASPIDTLELAQRMSEKFEGYPQWMAERVARSEARMGYNRSAIDMWDRLGINEVQAYDGQGGKSGVTDAECLARNGDIMTLSEALAADQDEHPNGTLGFVPVVESPSELVPLEPGTLTASAVQSPSIYAVDNDGLILSERAVGAMLADG